MTFWDALAVGSNLAAVYMLIAQHIRHRNYREKVHALLADEGFAEGEAAAIISGDKDLLVLNPWHGIPILTPAAFIVR